MLGEERGQLGHAGKGPLEPPPAVGAGRARVQLVVQGQEGGGDVDGGGRPGPGRRVRARGLARQVHDAVVGVARAGPRRRAGRGRVDGVLRA